MMTESEEYWNNAGETGYADAMYLSNLVGMHVISSTRNYLLEAATTVGLNGTSTILELGSGDGEMANNFLSRHFKSVEAHDLAPAGVARARKFRRNNTEFFCSDITKMDFPVERQYDAVFLVGVLHHIKAAAPMLVEKVSRVTNRFIVMEPKGDHIGRKLLEQLPSYKRAGEDSFETYQLLSMFTRCGLKLKYSRSYNLMPNFTPDRLYPLLSRLERFVDWTGFLTCLHTSQVFAFQKEALSA